MWLCNIIQILSWTKFRLHYKQSLEVKINIVFKYVWKYVFWYSWWYFPSHIFSHSKGGFEVTIKSWGKENLHLYRKYLHSNLMVVRAPSREIFHMWHKTPCTENLPAESFNERIQSRDMNEASHSQMRKLFFHQQIDNHLHKYNQTETPG